MTLMSASFTRCCAVLLFASPALRIAADLAPCAGETGICGVNGSVKEPYQTSLFVGIANATDCRTECYQRQAQCSSISYNPKSRFCRLYGTQIDDMGFTADASSAQAFYRADCFNCLYPCPTKAGVNLLRNAGFETPIGTNTSYGPWYNGDFYEISQPLVLASPGHNSRHAAQGAGGILISQLFPSCKTQLYDLTFYYKLQYVSDAEPVLQIEAGDLISTTNISPLTNNNTWVQFHDIFAGAPSANDTEVFVSIQGNNPSPIWVDDFVVTASTASLTPRAGAPELLINGGFETGSFAPFNVTDNTTGNTTEDYSIASPGDAGSNYALRYDSKFDYEDYLHIQQTIPTQPDVAYILSFSTKRIGHGREECYLAASPSIFVAAVGGGESSTLLTDQINLAGTLGKNHHEQQHGVWIETVRRLDASHMVGSSGMSITIRVPGRRRCPIFIDNISLKEAA